MSSRNRQRSDNPNRSAYGGTGGGGASSNLYFTDNAYGNGYYTDDAKLNPYQTNGGVVNYGNVDYFTQKIGTTGWYRAATGFNAQYVPAMNKTLISYECYDQAQLMAKVKYFDHATQSYSEEYNAVTQSPLTNDNHGVPCLIRMSSGYIFVMGCAHAHPLQMSSSANPDDITSWVQQPAMGVDAAYPHAFELNDGNMIIFTRGSSSGAGGNRRPLYVNKATVSGGTIVSYDTRKEIIELGSDSRFYQGSEQKIGNKIYIPCARADEADTFRLNYYMFVYDITTDTISNVDGTHTDTNRIDRASADLYYKVVDTSINGNKIGGDDCVFDAAGRMHIIWAETPIAGGTRIARHKYYTFGSGWSAVTDLYSAPTAFDTGLNRGPNGTVESHITTDTGVPATNGFLRATWTEGTWTPYNKISYFSENRWDRPNQIRDGIDDLRVIVSETAPSAVVQNGRGIRGFAFAGGLKPNRLILNNRTKDLLDRMTVKPDSNRIYLLNELIYDISNAGLYEALDALYLFVSHDQQAARLNIIQNSYNFTENNGLMWDPLLGYTGNGVNMWGDTNFNPTTAIGAKYTQNDAHFGMMGTGGSSGTTNNNIGLVSGGNIVFLNSAGIDAKINNNNTGNFFVIASGIQTSIIIQREPAGRKAFRVGAQIYSDADTNSALPNSNIALFRNGTSYGQRATGSLHFGRALTVNQVKWMNWSLRRYMASIGSFQQTPN